MYSHMRYILGLVLAAIDFVQGENNMKSKQAKFKILRFSSSLSASISPSRLARFSPVLQLLPPMFLLDDLRNFDDGEVEDQ